ncbi:MAG: hypothetical protein K5660_03355 [Paludibacteraceae bacterium]|nr:hypothetical protein [Paludibacteraceae bacterium]
MKVVNIDALDSLVEKIERLNVIEFVLDIVRPLERDYYYHLGIVANGFHWTKNPSSSLPVSPIWKLEHTTGYENIAHFIHTVPVYLRNSSPERKPDERCIIDLLGAYHSNLTGNGPYIELYLSAIDEECHDNEEHFKWLFTKVLLHELGHATMDIFNYEHYQSATEKVSYHTDFGKWREESMANAIALRIIKESGDKKFYAYSKRFMKSQPAEYALGVLMEGFRYWDLQSVMDGKAYGVDQTLQYEWLAYVQGKPTAKGLQEWNKRLIK